MDRASRKAVASQLRAIFEEMRKLPPPSGYCSVGSRRGLPDGLSWIDDPANPYAGPFDTEADLNRALILKYTENGLSRHKASDYTRTFAEIFQNHKPIFAHADFHRKNVLARNPATRVDDAQLDLVPIDWEIYGRYPSYWEYARAIFACGRRKDDWNDWVDDMLEPCRNEYAWVETLIREMRS